MFEIRKAVRDLAALVGTKAGWDELDTLCKVQSIL